ncbi:D-alanyl-D-alanine carboxypeptidase [Patescibacteria group bacterium]|nr:D-alanyl-D-alanine carboxypeptidase [Patescibacteria group bacterium]
MRKNLKYFLIAFLISLPFFWEINLLEKSLEDFFFWHEISKNPQILTAKINLSEIKRNSKSFEIKEGEVEEFQAQAESVISTWIGPDNQKEILFKKEIEKRLPIASLTKLMTANVVLEYYDLSQAVKISKETVFQEEEFGKLKVGEILTVKDLLYLLLIESSNDAAYALSEVIGQPAFVELMNLEAENLLLKNTHFSDSIGLDPNNYSTATDLVKFTQFLLQKPLIWEILALPEFNLYSPENIFHHKLLNTNEFLREWGNDLEIVGGKTGYTPEAKDCFLLVLKVPEKEEFLINVILGSENRFEEMKKLVDWIITNYKL